MYRRFVAAIAEALFALGSTGALADASATGSMSNLEIVLVDMNPGDGIAPSVTFGTSTGSFVHTYAYSGDPYGSVGEIPYSGSAFGAVSSNSSPDAYAGGAASVTGDPFAGTGGAQSSAFARPGNYTAGDGIANLIGDIVPSNFTLSAGTELIIRGTDDDLMVSEFLETRGCDAPSCRRSGQRARCLPS